MKVSIFSNDKSTMKDELIILAFTLICFIIGILLIILRPEVWFISSSGSVVFGVLLIMVFIMLMPCIIYRFATNNSDSKHKGDKK